MKPIRVIVGEDLDLNVDTIDEAISTIIYYYRTNCDVCIGEMLTNTQVHGITMDQAVNMYGYIMNRIEDDVLIHVVEDIEVIRTL